MKKQQHFKIVIMLRLDIMPGRQELIGVFRYMKRKGLRWDIQLRSPSEIKPEQFTGENAPDGIINAESQLSTAAETIVRTAIPVVSLDVPPEILSKRQHNIVFLHTDNEAIGKTCMEHLMEKGKFATWGFVHDVHHRPWSYARQRAFKAAVANAGLPFTELKPEGESDLAPWIKALPKPAAIMVACDRRAVQVLETCRLCEIDIPSQVVVVSVDNDEMYCECSSPTISSLDPDFENEGYLAAAELDRMLRKKCSQPAKTIVTPVGKVVERESTTPIPTSALLVQKAMDFIKNNACKGIGVKDVVEELGVSRRLADLRFQQYCGTSILETITDQRMSKVRRLLSTTHLSMARIAASCGFNTPKHLAVAFRKKFGCSMRDYRNARTSNS